MNPPGLIHLQLELECIGTDANNTLFRIPGESPDDIARFYVARHAAGYSTFIRHDIEPQVAQALRTLPPQEAFEDIEKVRRILGPISVTTFRSYYFTVARLPDAYPEVIRQADKFAILANGEPVSWAWSSRSNSRASELAVETKPAFQRRGYAQQVCSAWAREQLAHGRIAFYSHKWENLASEALAQSLGVIHFADGVNYE